MSTTKFDDMNLEDLNLGDEPAVAHVVSSSGSKHKPNQFPNKGNKHLSRSDSWRSVLKHGFLEEHAPQPPSAWNKNDFKLNPDIFNQIVNDAEMLKVDATKHKKDKDYVAPVVASEGGDKFTFPQNAQGKLHYIGDDCGRDEIPDRYRRALEADSMCAAIHEKFDNSVELAAALNSGSSGKKSGGRSSKFDEHVLVNLRTFAYENYPQFDDERTGKSGRLVLSEVTVRDGKFDSVSGTSRDLSYRRLYLYNAGRHKEFEMKEYKAIFQCCKGLCGSTNDVDFNVSSTHSLSSSLTIINVEDQLIDIYFDQQDTSIVNRTEVTQPEQQKKGCCAGDSCCYKIFCCPCILATICCKAICKFLCNTKMWTFTYEALDRSTDVSDMTTQETQASKLDMEKNTKLTYSTTLTGLHRVYITYLDVADRKVKRCCVTIDPEEDNAEVIAFVSHASKPPTLLTRGDAMVTGGWELEHFSHSGGAMASMGGVGSSIGSFLGISADPKEKSNPKLKRQRQKRKKIFCGILVAVTLIGIVAGIATAIVLALAPSQRDAMCTLCGDLNANLDNGAIASKHGIHDASQWKVGFYDLHGSSRKCFMMDANKEKKKHVVDAATN